MDNDITSQEQHVLWAANSTVNPNYSCENDEQILLCNAFSYGLIEARKIEGNFDTLDTKGQLAILLKVAEIYCKRLSKEGEVNGKTETLG